MSNQDISAQELKIRENRLRRMAERRGLSLQKSRRRDPYAIDYGTYMLLDAHTKAVIFSSLPHGYGLGLGDVEQCLGRDARAQS